MNPVCLNTLDSIPAVLGQAELFVLHMCFTLESIMLLGPLKQKLGTIANGVFCCTCKNTDLVKLEVLDTFGLLNQ